MKLMDANTMQTTQIANFAFSGVRWVPQQSASRPWGTDTAIQGDQVIASDGGWSSR